MAVGHRGTRAAAFSEANLFTIANKSITRVVQPWLRYLR